MLHKFPAVSVFSTARGWFALLGTERGLRRVTFGHATRAEAIRAVNGDAEPVPERDWHPELREQCEAFAEGAVVAFPAVVIDRDRPLTAFQQRVVEIVQTIPSGETLTYGQVAALAGSPGAARAVGQVMATNPVPLVIPCHRVVGACGHLGGFSAPGGIATKQALLTLEQTAALDLSH